MGNISVMFLFFSPTPPRQLTDLFNGKLRFHKTCWLKLGNLWFIHRTRFVRVSMKRLERSPGGIRSIMCCFLYEPNEREKMEKLVTDVENAICSKFGGTSAPSSFFNCGKEGENHPAQAGTERAAVLGQTVCYIVSAVVVNEGRVLMMREAKKSCRGTWYLPAGRVEKNESLEEGVIREVLEETGLNFQPVSLICIESQGTSWFRFTFVGYITGGKLKTLKEQDKESMEAGWFTAQEVFTSLLIRARDIYPLIDTGLKWYETKQEQTLCRLMPAKKSHGQIILSLLVVKRQEKDNNKSLFCLVLYNTTRDGSLCSYFPYKVVGIDGSHVTRVVDQIIRDFDSNIQYKKHGYVNAEHTGKPHGTADGVCLTVLVEVFLPVEKGILKGKYQWFELEEKCLAEKIWKLIDVKGCV